MLTAFVKSKSLHRNYFSFTEVLNFLHKLQEDGKLDKGISCFKELDKFSETCELDNAPNITVVER